MAAPVEERAILEIEVVHWVILVRQLMHIAPGTSAIGLRRRPAPRVSCVNSLTVQLNMRLPSNRC